MRATIKKVMNISVHSRFSAALALLFVCASFTCLLTSCGPKKRKPPPTITIVILDAYDAYMLDGQRMKRSTLEARLQRMADTYRREITSTSRAFVRISAKKEGPSSYREKQRIMKYCIKVGLDKVALH